MTTAPEPFAIVTMDGDQFEGGHLPVRALAELQRYAALVLRAAELKWLEVNTGKELPDDFSDHFQLIITKVESGSATSILERTNSTPYDSFYEDGRTAFEETLQGVLDDVVTGTWRRLLEAPEFGEFGSSLNEGEFLSIPPASPNLNKNIRVTPALFRRKIHIAHEKYVTPPAMDAVLVEREHKFGWVVGRLVALDGMASNFSVLVNGERINGRFKEVEVFDDMKAALGTSEKSPVVRIYGRLSYLGGDLERILEAVRVQVLEVDGEEWSGRFIQLADLAQGWSDEATASEPIAFSAIDGAREVLRHVSESELEIPGIYPSEDGGVSLEWASARRVITIEVSPDGEFELSRFSRDGESTSKGPTKNIGDVKKFIDDADVEAVRG